MCLLLLIKISTQDKNSKKKSTGALKKSIDVVNKKEEVELTKTEPLNDKKDHIKKSGATLNDRAASLRGVI